jgi:hypothetical protein
VAASREVLVMGPRLDLLPVEPEADRLERDRLAKLLAVVLMLAVIWDADWVEVDGRVTVDRRKDN